MVALNKTINWKPESTGTGRFGNWLENLVDWNLSRSRYWGTPLPIWRTADGLEEKCIGSIAELNTEIKKAEAAGFMPANFELKDMHRPYVDDVILVSSKGEKMTRELDLIDVWFDSGAMPYAQLHYPFENKEAVDGRKNFPADFIAEGVDQTRGWFYTLHAIGTLCFDSVAFKNVVSNGLVLDKNGNKMSKRLGNAVDPFETIGKYGPDATRWYMITNAQPWDNLKFDIDGIVEVQRKFFGTLHNTYSFFAMYANVDNYAYNQENAMPMEKRTELDRWIISRLNSLIKEVDNGLSQYDPTPAARAIESFVDEHLSNWFVRLARKRFWHGEFTDDKKAAYDTLFECLQTVSILMSPFAPFYADALYTNLNTPVKGTPNDHSVDSVHLAFLPKVNELFIDAALEAKMELAQKVSSMVLSIRKKENIRVRQPLQTIRIPLFDQIVKAHIESVKNIILSEVNVKEIEFVDESQASIIKNLKLNFKTLGKKCGKFMKDLQLFANENQALIIKQIEMDSSYSFNAADGSTIELLPEDVEIIPVDIPGWKVVNSGALTVALDVTLTEELKREGLAREFVNRIQNLRKEAGFEVTDKISVKIGAHQAFNEAVEANSEYIRSQVLAESIVLVEQFSAGQTVEIDEGVSTNIEINKL
jgi:isoleucyl-tRNA synthetase